MAIVSVKGQIIFPKKIVEELDLKEGANLYFKIIDNNSRCEIFINEISDYEYKVNLLSKNQLTLPKELRTKMNIEANDTLEITLKNGIVILSVKKKSWINDAIKLYEDCYDFIGMIDLGNFDKKTYIGEKKSCRFCSRNSDEVKFKKIAHAIPELLGNKVLFSNEECDECNHYFGILENDLGNYLHFWRTASMQRGKKGVPKYKNGLFSMGSSKNGRLLVQETIGNNKVLFDDGSKTITIQGTQKPYVPINVYKTFVKMALSLIPKDELINFEDTIIWLQDKEFKIKPKTKLILIEQFIPGPNPYPQIQMLAFSRKDNSTKAVPYYTFVLCYSNFVFQIYVPFCKLDTANHIEENMNCIVFPSNYAFVLPEGTVRPQFKDFTSSNKTKDEPISIEFTYGEKTEISPQQVVDNGIK